MTDIATRVYPSTKTYEGPGEMKDEMLRMLAWFWPEPQKEGHAIAEEENHLVISLVISEQEVYDIEVGQITTRKEARDVVHAVSAVHPVARVKGAPFPVRDVVPQFGLT